MANATMNGFDALNKARAKFGTIVFDKTNPHFKNRYASLQAVMKATFPALIEVGICPITRTLVDLDNTICETVLVYEGQEFIRAAWPVGKVTTPPQQLGSALTYARRYTIQAVLGVAADEDDDGNEAQSAAVAQASKPDFTVCPCGSVKGKRWSELDDATLTKIAALPVAKAHLLSAEHRNAIVAELCRREKDSAKIS